MPPSRRFVYEYHLRDHQQNLRLAFRAETAQRVLRLTMEDDRDEDGSSYPAFRRVNATRDYSLAYQGRASAAVSASQPGPSTRLPVVGGDVVKVDFFYTTPAGPQHQRAAAPLPTASPAPRSLRLLPVLLPAPGSAGQPGGVDGHSGRAGGVGLQLQLGGLLSGRARPRPASPVAPYENAETTGGPAPQPTMTLPAYLRWELRDAAGDVVQSDVVEVPTTEAGRDRWQHLSTSIAVDKGPDGKLTGTLNVQLLNEGSQPVYVDSLTIRHPQPALLVSQENHYYPFGMNLSGVAVNTRPAEMMSKRLYNGGSELEDELLGAEGGNYSTFYRRYDATLGRFLGVDPLAGKYANLSPYQFSFNDPVNYQDPSGADPGDGGMVFVHGRLANPRNVYGRRETDGGMGFLSHERYNNFLSGRNIDGVMSIERAIYNGGINQLGKGFARALSQASGKDYSYSNGAFYWTYGGYIGIGRSEDDENPSFALKARYTKKVFSARDIPSASQMWNSNFARNYLMPDAVGLNAGVSGAAVVGLSYGIGVTWLTRGPEASFWPVFTLDGGARVGAEFSAGLSFTRGWRVANRSGSLAKIDDIDGSSLMGHGADLSGTVLGVGAAAGVGLTDDYMQPTWMTQSLGFTPGLGASIGVTETAPLWETLQPIYNDIRAGW